MSPIRDRIVRDEPWCEGDAPVRSSDLKTSVSWLNDMVKGIKKLRLNQKRIKASSRELDECCASWVRRWSSSDSSGKLEGSSVSMHQLVDLEGLAHSAGDS